MRHGDPQNLFIFLWCLKATLFLLSLHIFILSSSSLFSSKVYEADENFPAALDKYYHVLDLVHPSLKDGLKTVHTNIAVLLMNAGNISGSIEHWKKVGERSEYVDSSS